MDTFRIELELDYRYITTTIADIEDWYGIEIPEVTLASMMKESPYIISEMSEIGLDTVGRERIISCFLKFIGIDDEWPINGDSEDVKNAFYAKLRDKLDEFGISNNI